MAQNENTAADAGGFIRCTEVLERERTLVAKIAELQDLVKKAALKRQWLDFEALMKALGDAGGRFEELDREREEIFDAISGSSGFYAFVSRFPLDDRKALVDTYRNLKMEMTKVRLESESLMNYLAEVQLLVEGFLGAAFPDRKGRMYSRNGAQVQADMRSMVLNRHF